MATSLRLSVLDQSPVPAGHTPAEALNNSLDLAKHVDKLGYTRLWYSEHHAMEMLACTAPELLILRAAAATERIRVGSGGVMLPHYSAFKVAELFRTLHAMFPNRIDLGIGRAPGGGQLESLALRRTRGGPQPDDFPQQLAELQAYLHPERFPALARSLGVDHPFRKVLVSPAAPGAPDLWLLGSSMWSAVTAAAEGLPYAFAHFFSAQGTRQAIEFYRRNFRPYTGPGSPTPSGAPGPASETWASASNAPRSTDSNGVAAGKNGATIASDAARSADSNGVATDSNGVAAGINGVAAGINGVAAGFSPRINAPENQGALVPAYRQTPEATIAIGVICAPTQEEAEFLHSSVRLLQRRIRTGDRRPVATPEDALKQLQLTPQAPNPFLSFTAGSLDEPDEEFPRYVVGTPDHVAARLHTIAHELEINELIVNTITHSHEARRRSYTLLAEAMGLANTSTPARQAA